MAVDGASLGTTAVGDGTVDLTVGLPGRTGAVGGIESLVLDGRRLFFGFDFSSDQVLSPLIDDEEAMARFAARHMRQRTGAHDELYWAQLVRSSVDGSELVWRDEQRTFTTRVLETGDAGAAQGHLLYLLSAATVETAASDATAHQAMSAHSTVANWSLLFAPYIRGSHGSASR
ncbi:hypothetical protein [Streptomyces niveus]|uniref:hypothetical protein n=1 Tax=Streptomyces niveus TaxID=193462 RepID=UPI0033AD56D8